MWWFVLMCVLGVGTGVVVGRACYDDLADLSWALLIGGLVAAITAGGLCCFAEGVVIPATTGMGENYTSGQRDVTILCVERRGYLWKTWEVNSGYTPRFSVVDEEVVLQIEKARGKTLHVEYVGWLIQPYRRGDSGYEITRVLGEVAPSTRMDVMSKP